MRTKNSIYNLIGNFGVFIVKTIMTFIVRAILISEISQAYIGVNSLFTNILSILSLAELGISSAIGFSLYKPLSENNNKDVSTLMSFYRKAYFAIGSIIFVLGLSIIPFLTLIVKESINHLFIIYILFLINTCSSYFLSYKDILITSDQKSYLLTKITLFSTFLINCSEIIILLSTKNYIFYLLIKIFLTIIERLFINLFISRKYSNVEFKSKNKLEEKTKKEIFKNVKAMFYHKIGDCMINSTDNIIISSFINISTVALYSNYLLIISYLMSFASIVYNSLLASLGNLVVSEGKEKKYEIFKKINFLGFSIFSFSTVILMNVFNVFIELFAGKDYVLNMVTVTIIVINFYITGMRVPSSNMKTAAGLFDVDKYTPIIQSIINIVFSIILSIKFGLNGVLIGTFLSSILPSIQRPYIVYKHILKKSSKEYFIEYFKYAVLTIFATVITILINSTININSNILLFFQRSIISAVIYLLIYIIVFYKKKEFIYFKNLGTSYLNRRTKNEK